MYKCISRLILNKRKQINYFRERITCKEMFWNWLKGYEPNGRTQENSADCFGKWLEVQSAQTRKRSYSLRTC